MKNTTNKSTILASCKLLYYDHQDHIYCTCEADPPVILVMIGFCLQQFHICVFYFLQEIFLSQAVALQNFPQLVGRTNHLKELKWDLCFLDKLLSKLPWYTKNQSMYMVLYQQRNQLLLRVYKGFSRGRTSHKNKSVCPNQQSS